MWATSPVPGHGRTLATLDEETLASARDWLETTFAADRTRGLLAPWVLHTGLGPDAAASGYMALRSSASTLIAAYRPVTA